MKKIPFISFSVTHTGHVLWRLQLFGTKTDCTETPLGDTGGWWRIPVVLSPTVMGRRGEKGAAHGPPPLPAVHPCAGWGFCANMMLVFWDLFCLKNPLLSLGFWEGTQGSSQERRSAQHWVSITGFGCCGFHPACIWEVQSKRDLTKAYWRWTSEMSCWLSQLV